MRRPRWPAIAPPTCGGVHVHGRRLLAADTHLTLDLVRIVAFPGGLGVHLALTAIGRPAERARYQTRPLTDPADRSARWSYHAVRAGAGHLAVADPYLPKPDVHTCDPWPCIYRTEPRYWLGASPPGRSVTIAAQWPQIGLPQTTTTVPLALLEQPSTNRPRT